MKTKITIHGNGSCFYYAFCLTVLVSLENTGYFDIACENFFDATPEEVAALKEELPKILHEFPNPFTEASLLKKLIEQCLRKKIRIFIRDNQAMYLDDSYPTLAFPSAEALKKHLSEQRKPYAYATDVEVHAMAHRFGVTIQVNEDEPFNGQGEDTPAWLHLDTIQLEHVMIGAVGHYNCYLPKADHDRLSQQWITSLFSENDLKKIVPLLSKKGITDLRGEHGETVLHWACFHGHYNVVITLCKIGMDLHCVDTAKQRTGLHWSVKNFSNDKKNQKKIIQLMLKNSVDASLLDYKGKSAYGLAMTSKDQTLKKLFAQKKVEKAFVSSAVNEWRSNLSLHLTIDNIDFTVPGNQLHAELKAMENLFRLTLTHVEHDESAYVMPEKSAAGAGRAGLVTPILSPEKAGAGASYVDSGDTNFVVASLGFVITLTEGGADFISLPIRLPNKPLFTVYDSQNDYFTFFTQGARGKQAHYPLFETELKDKVGVLDEGIFESNYVHSEQALLTYLEKPETIRHLVLALKYALRDRPFKKIHQGILDLHTSRYMCKRCEKCVRSFLNPYKREFSFQKYLSVALQREFSWAAVPGILPLVARVTADAEFDGPRKMPKEHDAELVNEDVLDETNLLMKDTGADVPDSPVYKFPFLAHGLHQHSVATSGGSDDVEVRRQHVAYRTCVTQAYTSAAKTIQTVFRDHRDKRLQADALFHQAMALYEACDAIKKENMTAELSRDLEDIPEYAQLIEIVEKLRGDHRNELARLVYEMERDWDILSELSDDEDESRVYVYRSGR